MTITQLSILLVALAGLAGAGVLALVRRRELRKTTLVAYHAIAAYRKILEQGIPVMARDGMLLGAIRHHGFLPFDDDPDVMIADRDFERLMRADLSPYYVQFRSSFPRPDKHNGFPYTDSFAVRLRGWPHKVLDGTVLFRDEERSARAGEGIYALGYRLYGRNESELFYSAYGHARDEDPMYYMNERDLFPPIAHPFYGGQVYVPNNAEKLLREHFGQDVFTVMFNKKSGRREAVGPPPNPARRLDMNLYRRLEEAESSRN
jgi:hypothetical protein